MAIPTELRARVRAHAEQTEMSVSDIVTKALTAYFANLDRPLGLVGTGWDLSVKDTTERTIIRDRGATMWAQQQAQIRQATITLSDADGNQMVIETEHFTMSTSKNET